MMQVNHPLVQAVYLTLLHSLWQGIVIAIITAIIIIGTRRNAAAVRYNLLIAAMAIFFAGIGVTFYFQYISLSTPGITPSHLISPVAIVDSGEAGSQSQATQWWQGVLQLLNVNAGLIVWIWILIVLFKSAHLLLGLRKIYQLKHYHTYSAGDYWNEQLHTLSAKIGLKKTVTLLQSGVAKVPMVVGHLKPVILFPLGVLTSLPQEEVEAVLLHELAHIRRKDYIVNMMQAMAELLFFFHPAIAWLSASIRNERENCCDDIAIGQVKDKKRFVQALVSFQEYHLSTAYTTGFPGRKNHLLNRVKRIITNSNQTLTHMEKFILASCIVLSGLVTVAFSQAKDKSPEKKEAAKSVKKELEEDRQDTTSYRKYYQSNISKEIDGKKYELKEANDSIISFYVDGVKIAPEKMAAYQPVIDRIHKEMREDQEKLHQQQKQLQAKRQKLFEERSRLAKLEMEKHTAELKDKQRAFEELSKDLQNKLTNQTEAQRKMMKVEMEKRAAEMRALQDSFKVQSEENNRLMKEQSEIRIKKMQETQEAFKKQAEANQQRWTNRDSLSAKMNRQQELFKKQTEAYQQRMKEEAERRMEKLMAMQDNFRKQTETQQKKLMEESEKRLEKFRIQQEKFKKDAEQYQQQLMEESEKKMEKFRNQQNEYRKMMADSLNRSSFSYHPVKFRVKSNPVAGEIADRLKEDQLVDDRNNMSFTLTNKEMTVNGVKQPETIQKKYIEKYVNGPDDKFSLSYRAGSKTSK